MAMNMKRQRDWEESKPKGGDGLSSVVAAPAVNEAKESDEHHDYQPAKTEKAQARVKCPYLDTVDRQLIDFDSEKLCSQTLTNRNVYVCLVCGKFFEGRGKHTPAFTHSLQCNHYVFMNMESGRSYCLPDGYEILDRSLNDVQKCLSPSFSLKDIVSLDNNAALARDVHGATYLPGFIGLNNLNATDDTNVILHLLSHISPFRDYFLQQHLYSLTQSKLVRDFGLVLRKLWSPHNFKSTVSPQELIQTITVESKRKFSIGTKCEALELLIWLLASLQKGLDKKAKPLAHEPSVIYEPFQGVVEVTTQTKKLVTNFEEQKFLEKAQDEIVKEATKTSDGWVKKVNEVPFTFLSLEIPPCPLFRDAHGGLVIPQVPLFQLLQKFDGETWTDQITNEAHVRKQYRIKKLPRYLILHLVRFTKNNFYLEKNPTIVTFPVRNLEMKDYLYASNDNQHQIDLQEKIAQCPSLMEIQDWDVDRLKQLIESLGSGLHINELQALLGGQSSIAPVDLNNAQEMKENLLYIAKRVVERVELFRSTKYDLVANICHESEAAANGIDVGDSNMGDVFQKSRRSATTAPTSDDVINRGSYKIHIPFKPTNQWYEMQDLHVAETTPQLVGVSESYILVYEKKQAKRKDNKVQSSSSAQSGSSTNGPLS